MQATRRIIIKAATAAILAPSLASAAKLSATHSQAEGPFYPVALPADADADLTQVSGMSRPATGIPSILTGQVTDLNGCVIKEAKIEIWQCDAFGAYHHPRDRGNQAEAEFQGYGFTNTDNTGAYRFKTIRPVSYPGRTPHIHVIVSKPGMRSLTTQLYVKDEPRNLRDGLFRRIPEEKRPGLLASFPDSESETDSVVANFNIVIGHTASCA
jgi:protocatechuate 3,4-dioxygenase beta subunit